MKDFKDWEEVRTWIEDTDKMDGVFVGNMYFSHTYMSCGEGCCDEHFESVDQTLSEIKSHADNDVTKVDRC